MPLSVQIALFIVLVGALAVGCGRPTSGLGASQRHATVGAAWWSEAARAAHGAHHSASP